MHSIGVARIVWNFTKDTTQAVAGLLHDISTPVFAHTIDFMNNDHIAQESTEDKTLFFIENSKEITLLLKSAGIHLDAVCDYHKYPIADNDTPMLSADRLEYTLGNAYNVYNEPLSLISTLYDDLTVSKNEHGVDELCFRSFDTAKRFTEIALRNSHFYVSDTDRYLMQYLAEIVRYALSVGALTPDDLYTTESEVIEKLREHSGTAAVWGKYTGISNVATSEDKPSLEHCFSVNGKKRYIDVLVQTEDGAKRISEVDSYIKADIESFLSLDFSKWLYAV